MKSKEFGINVPLDLLKIYITKRHARYQTILLAKIKYIMSCLLINNRDYLFSNLYGIYKVSSINLCTAVNRFKYISLQRKSIITT